MIRKAWKASEDLLSRVPRVGLLALAVLVLRNPFVEGSFSLWGWYFKMPLEFVLLLSAALAAAAAMRVASTPDGPEGTPLA